MDRPQIPALRSLDDFIKETDRFQLPDYTNLSKWNNRMKGNLIYYQTNYMIGILILFILIGFCAPGSLMIGMMSMALAIAVFLYMKSNKPVVDQFAGGHPNLTVLGIFISGYFMVWVMDCVFVFLLATLFPIFLMLVHSSLRMRGVKSKLEGTLEAIGVKHTLMGIFLNYLGQELDKLE